jgi:hypothetical protein
VAVENITFNELTPGEVQSFYGALRQYMTAVGVP